MKYKVGEKVKVKSWKDMIKAGKVDGDGDIEFNRDEPYFVRGMKEYCGKTVTIDSRYSGPFCDKHYHIKEDEGDWCWSDSMFEDARKFKIGDKVIGNKNNCYLITREGWKGKVIDLLADDKIRVKGEAFGRINAFVVNEEAFDLLKCEKKIVITSDGTTTTAKFYEGDKVIRSAEATCSTDDEFKFEVGAELAFNRLIKTQPEEKKFWSGKDICTDNKGYSFYTTGKIYEVKNGTLFDDFGGYAFEKLTCIGDLKKKSKAKWLEVVE